MSEIIVDSRRISVWMAMADHFLDTETRPDIPLTAMRCLAAGLTAREARDIWRYEVSRAVGFNVWCVAGEWAGWDQQWLIATTDRLRRRWDNTPGTARWLRYRIRVHGMHGFWLAIERCMEVVGSVRGSAARNRAAHDLAWLARQYFDFCPTTRGSVTEPDRDRRRALYPAPFCAALRSALVAGEAELGDQRVRTALKA